MENVFWTADIHCIHKTRSPCGCLKIKPINTPAQREKGSGGVPLLLMLQAQRVFVYYSSVASAMLAVLQWMVTWIHGHITYSDLQDNQSYRVRPFLEINKIFKRKHPQKPRRAGL